MALSSAILQMKTGYSEKVASALKDFPSVTLEETTPKGEFILVIEAKSLDVLHDTCLEIEKLEGVLGIYPSYVTTEDET